MLTRTRSRFRTEALWALVLLVSVPAVSQAQQTGLFPLRPIRRERVPCAAEDPVYRMYREQYYGYHPTCWRKFPPGWGCQSPEAPNAAAAFEKLKRQAPPADYGDRGDAMPPEDDLGPRGGPDPLPNRNPALPATPAPAGGRDLFNLDSPKPSNPPAPNPPEIPPPGAPGNRSAPSSALPSPAAPEIGFAPRDAGPGAASAESFLPLPEAPAAEAPPAPTINPLPAVDNPASASNDNDPAAASSAQPQPVPQRRGLFSSLFNSLRRR